MWRDDLDTALRHMELYDQFGCPAAHIQETFRCVVRQGNIDPKSPESLNSRVHACWINPGLAPSPPGATASAPPPGGQGSTTRSNAGKRRSCRRHIFSCAVHVCSV
jgi:hypothetical protein